MMSLRPPSQFVHTHLAKMLVKVPWVLHIVPIIPISLHLAPAVIVGVIGLEGEFAEEGVHFRL